MQSVCEHNIFSLQASSVRISHDWLVNAGAVHVSHTCLKRVRRGMTNASIDAEI